MRSFWIILATLGGIILAFIIMAASIYLFGRYAEQLGTYTGQGPVPTAGPDAFFGYFSNSIGLAIGAAGTVTAIVLAYGGLRTSEVQATTAAVQEFRPEIDQFVANSNALFSKICELVELGILQNRCGQTLARGAAIHLFGPELQTKSQTTAEDIKRELSNVRDCRVRFERTVDEIHNLLGGNGNIFFRKMIQENIKMCTDEIRALRTLSQQGFRIPAHRDFSDADVVKHLHILSRGAIKSRMLTAERSDELRSLEHAIRYGQEDSLLSVSELLDSLADCFPFSDLDPSWNSWSGEDYDQILDFDRHRLSTNITAASALPDGSFVVDADLTDLDVSVSIMIDQTKVTAAPYRYVIPIYVKLANPATGLLAMQQHFSEFGAKKDLLHLFIDAHSARLSFNHRPEGDHFFRKITNTQESAREAWFWAPSGLAK